MPALLALFGPKQGLRIPLSGRLTLGRGLTADLQLVDGKVSREHCRIDATGARAMIEDLGSQNGTYVNGEVISRPTPIGEGDEIMVGDTLLLVAGDQIEVANARYGAGTLLRLPDANKKTIRITDRLKARWYVYAAIFTLKIRVKITRMEL